MGPDTSSPVLVNDTPLTLTSTVGTITAALLEFNDDVSGHAQETYTAIATPGVGELLKSGVRVQTFTQADIDNGLMTYHLLVASATIDSFTFTVSDAAGNTISHALSFYIQNGPQPDTIPPQLVNDTGLSVAPNATVPITAGNLFFIDNDSSHAQETYTVSVPVPPDVGTLLLNGVAATSFTQADIDNGLVSYHETARSVSANFTFKVTDAAGNATSDEQFPIQISQPDITPPVLIDDTGASVVPGGTVTITANMLRFDDNISSHAQESYSLLDGLFNGTLLLNGMAGQSFTQADIDNGLVSYHETAAGASVDSFTFKVIDAAGNATVNEQFQVQIGQSNQAFTATAPLMTNTSGSLVFDQVVNSQMVFTTVGGLGPEWEFDGSGEFLGAGNTGLLIRNDGTVSPGTLFVGTVTGSSVAFTQIGGLGTEWQFVGNADFLGTGQSEFLIRNVGSVEPGTLDLGQVVNGSVQFTQVGGLGTEWQFEGTGNFLGDGHQGFLFRNTGTVDPGALYVGEIVNGAASFTPIGGVGTEWDFEGVGDFLGDGHTDFLIRNNGSVESGALAIGEVVNGQLSFTDIGGVGQEWQFVGTGNYIDKNRSDFLMRNAGSGALVVGSFANSTLNFTTVGAIGPEWTFHNTDPALLA